MRERGGPNVPIGKEDIKSNRLSRPVKCHPPDVVGEYVPFYFCPRSIMLYIFYMDNLPGLTYHGGQGPIVHLEFNVDEVIKGANEADVRWAFTNANAAAHYARFCCQVDELEIIDWEAVANNDFSGQRVKEAKQSEFLVKDMVPWEFVERIGVHSEEVGEQAREALGSADHQPPVSRRRGWYF
jgi:hypothetical protein